MSRTTVVTMSKTTVFFAIWRRGDRELYPLKYSSRDAAVRKAMDLAAKGEGPYFVLASIGTAERVSAAEWVGHEGGPIDE